MATITTSGRTALAQSMLAMPLHLAWGTGSAGWDTTPVAPSGTETALVAEIGRLVATVKEYCTPNAGGSIVVPQGTFAASVSPTRYLHLRFDFPYDAGGTSTIREAGLFLGTTSGAAGPYFTPGQLTSPGTLFELERFTAFTLSAGYRQRFEFVLVL